MARKDKKDGGLDVVVNDNGVCTNNDGIGMRIDIPRAHAPL